MTRDVMWLFFWTTMAFWAGCSSHEAHQGALIGDDVTFEATDLKSDEATPSLTGLDRSNWQPIKVGPVRGQVPHHPRYFDTDTCTLIERRPNPLAGASIEAQAAAVTGGARALCDSRDWVQIPGLIGKTAFDIAAAPVKIAIDPPTTIHHTPSQ